MIKQIFVCDKCEKDITGNVALLVEDMHFCPECKQTISGVLKQWIVGTKAYEPEIDVDDEIIVPVEEPVQEPEVLVDAYQELLDKEFAEEEPQKYPAKKKKVLKRAIDWDKACALKKAGWTNRAIAEECKIKFSTVNVEIYKKMKLYDAKKAQEEADAKRRVVEEK